MGEHTNGPTAADRSEAVAARLVGDEAIGALPTSSFERFFDENHVRLFRALYLLTGSRVIAEDALQDAFLKVWQRWERVRGMDEPVGYLYRVAMNVVRSGRRRRAIEAHHAEARSGTGDAIVDVERRDWIMGALAALPIRQRAAIVLTEYLGYGSDGAATILGVRAVTVRSLASQGRAAMRARLEDDDG